MDCREFLHRYSDYDDSLIPAHEADRFRAHMSECPSCARYDRVLRKGRMVARQLPGPEPSAEFIPRLRMRLQASRVRRRPLSARVAVGLAAVTVLMVTVSAVSVLDQGPRTGQAFREPVEAGPAPGATAPTIGTRAPGGGAVSVRRVVTVLPATEPGPLRGWAVKKVAPAPAASYSPLETGPPSYRREAPSARGPTDTERRALD